MKLPSMRTRNGRFSSAFNVLLIFVFYHPGVGKFSYEVLMFSTTFQTGTESRTTEHTIEIILDGEKYAVKTTTKILRHTNPHVVGRVMTAVLNRRYKTERGATMTYWMSIKTG